MVQVEVLGKGIRVDEVIDRGYPAEVCLGCHGLRRFYVRVQEHSGQSKLCWRCLILSKESGKAKDRNFAKHFHLETAIIGSQ